MGRITTDGVVTDYPVDATLDGIAAGPDGALWAVGEVAGVTRTPACGLGFSAGVSAGVLTMNFHLGIDTPATFSILLHDAQGEFQPFSKSIPAVVPPRAFTMAWSGFSDKGNVTVRPQLAAAGGQGLCAEWTTVNTAP